MFANHLGEHLFDPKLIFFRSHTKPPPRSNAFHSDKKVAWIPEVSRKHNLQPWDTVKPLGNIFKDLRRVILFDDDHWKSVEGEESNMVLLPRWQNGDSADGVLEKLVENVLTILGDLPNSADVRDCTQKLTESLTSLQNESSENNIVSFDTESTLSKNS